MVTPHDANRWQRQIAAPGKLAAAIEDAAKLRRSQVRAAVTFVELDEGLMVSHSGFKF